MALLKTPPNYWRQWIGHWCDGHFEEILINQQGSIRGHTTIIKEGRKEGRKVSTQSCHNDVSHAIDFDEKLKMVRGNRRDCSMRFRWIWVVVLQLVSGHGNANYGDALSKCLLFLEAQRSGRLPSTQRVSWRDHSGLTDGLLQGVDLVGGYYDAGDHVKFGLPMAFTVTMLSWSVVEYGEQLAAAGQLGHALEAIKWGTDYFLKAHSHPHLQLLWGEVGDGNTDHYCWQRPEDMTTPRHAYKIDAANPGSDLAGETAAAMASASIVFRASNPSYSNLLLHHAKQLFEFGDKYRGKYDQSIGVVKNYYTSVSGYGDELLWGASWMYQATGNEDYLKYIVDNAESLGGTGWAITEFSWDVKYAGLQVLAAKVLMQGQGTQYSSTLEKYKSKAEFFLCACLQMNDPDSNVHLTPGGLLYIRQWNNMQYVSSASFLLTVYSDYLAAAKASLNCPKAQMDPSRLLDFATSQVNYILGKNPRATSYLVGYGKKYPEKVHHRGASIVAYKEKPSFVGCKQGYDSWYSSDSPNPNILVGALVGGPDKHDNFEDDRRNFMQTEPCTYNVAPLIGVLAKLNGFPASESAWIPHHPSGALRMAAAAAERPVEFSHEIGKSWRRGGRTYSRHKVTVTNVSNKPITHLNIALSADDTCTENGPHMLPVWGLSRGSGAYTLPPWLKVLFPGHGFHFVYVQEGDTPIMPLNICLLSHK